MKDWNSVKYYSAVPVPERAPPTTRNRSAASRDQPTSPFDRTYRRPGAAPAEDVGANDNNKQNKTAKTTKNEKYIWVTGAPLTASRQHQDSTRTLWCTTTATAVSCDAPNKPQQTEPPQRSMLQHYADLRVSCSTSRHGSPMGLQWCLSRTARQISASAFIGFAILPVHYSNYCRIHHDTRNNTKILYY